MLAAVGLGVVHLHRAAVGPVRLRGNAAWKHADLSPAPASTATAPVVIAVNETAGDHALFRGVSSEPTHQAAVAETAGKSSSTVEEKALVDTAFSVELAPEQHSELTAEQKSWLWQTVGRVVLPSKAATANAYSTTTDGTLWPPERPSWPYHGRARALQTLLLEKRQFGAAQEDVGRRAPCTEAEAEKIRSWLFRHGYLDSA